MAKFGNYLLIGIIFLTLSLCSVSKFSFFNQISAVTNKPKFVMPATQFKTGDMILREGKSFISQVLSSFSKTDKHFSHAGLILIKNGQTFVCHILAAEGTRSNKIRLETIESFCNPAENSSFAIFRSNVDENKVDSVLMVYLHKKITFDNDFDLNSDDKMYCTELVYKTLTIANQNKKFIDLSHGIDKDYVACDNLYLNPATHLIYSHNY